MDEWQGLLGCLVLSFGAAAPPKCVLGVCSPQASRNTAQFRADGVWWAWGCAIGPAGQGRGWHWVFWGTAGHLMASGQGWRCEAQWQPCSVPVAVSRPAWLLCRKVFMQNFSFSFVSSTLFAVSCLKSLFHMLIAFYWSHFCCSFCSLEFCFCCLFFQKCNKS